MLENQRILAENSGNILYQDRSTMGYMFVFDLTDPGTLLDILKILSYIDATEKSQPKIPPTKKILIGNKIDTVY